MNGDRTGSGHLSRSAAAVENRDSVEQRAQRKAQRYVVLGDAGQGVDITDPIAVLEALGHISVDEASAGAEISRLHNVLYGVAWPRTTGYEPKGASPSLRERETETYNRAMKLVGQVGGNAVRIVRYVCSAREMPAWVTRKPMVTVDRKHGRIVARVGLDRAALRLMSVELPALRKALAACAAAGIVSVRRGRR